VTFILTTPPEDATGDVQAMYERHHAHFGYLPNYARVFSHRPEIMTLWAELQRGIRRHMDARRFELVTVAAARALGSSYCTLAHGAKLAGMLSERELAGVIDGSGATLSDAERAMMDYAAQVARDAAAVTAEDVDRLKAHGFDDAEIFGIAAAAAGRAFFSKLVEGLGATPDAAYAHLPDDLKQAFTVGRPIDGSRSHQGHHQDGVGDGA